MVLNAEDHSDKVEAGPAVFCLQCSYNLSHLPPGECPECGSPFDPEDLHTIKTQDPADRYSLKRNGWKIAGQCFIWLWVLPFFVYLIVALFAMASSAYIWFTNQ